MNNVTLAAFHDELEKIASKSKILSMSDEAFAAMISRVKNRDPYQAERLQAIREGRKFGRQAAKAKPAADPSRVPRRGADPTREELIMRGRDAVGIRRAIIRPQPRSPSPEAYRGAGGGSTATSNIGITDAMASKTWKQRQRNELQRMRREGPFARSTKNPLEHQAVQGRGGNIGTPGAPGTRPLRRTDPGWA